MINKSQPIPKIRGFVAENANILVFLYRRSHKVTFLIQCAYSKTTESWEKGSRFYGRIYPNRCNLSPNGRNFIYFAMGNHHQSMYCWTALCSPPKLTAQLLIEHKDTWQSGGYFVDDTTIQLYINAEVHSVSKTFGKYKLACGITGNDYGWGSGKRWELKEWQINPSNNVQYPAVWEKSFKKQILIRTLKCPWESTAGIGEYNPYQYSIKRQAGISIDPDEDFACIWADFDRLGRIWISRGSLLFMYENISAFEKK